MLLDVGMFLAHFSTHYIFLYVRTTVDSESTQNNIKIVILRKDLNNWLVYFLRLDDTCKSKMFFIKDDVHVKEDTIFREGQTSVETYPTHLVKFLSFTRLAFCAHQAWEKNNFNPLGIDASVYRKRLIAISCSLSFTI